MNASRWLALVEVKGNFPIIVLALSVPLHYQRKTYICDVSKQPLAFLIDNGIYLEIRLEEYAYILQECAWKIIIQDHL